MIENDAHLDGAIQRMLARNRDNYDKGLIPPEPEYENSLVGKIIGRPIVTPWSPPADSVTNQELAEKLSASLRLSKTLQILSEGECESLREGLVYLSREQLDGVRKYINIINAFHQEVDMLPETAKHLITFCCNCESTPELLESIFVKMFKDLSSVEDRLDAAVADRRITEERRTQIQAMPIAFERMIASLDL